MVYRLEPKGLIEAIHQAGSVSACYLSPLSLESRQDRLCSSSVVGQGFLPLLVLAVSPLLRERRLSLISNMRFSESAACNKPQKYFQHRAEQPRARNHDWRFLALYIGTVVLGFRERGALMLTIGNGLKRHALGRQRTGGHNHV